MHLPRTYNEERFVTETSESRWPLDKHGVYIFPEDKVFVDSAYFKVEGLSREVIEEDLHCGLIRYQWFVECQGHKPHRVYKFPAYICVNCSEKKICPPFSYIDGAKERASCLRGRGYFFTSQGFEMSIKATTSSRGVYEESAQKGLLNKILSFLKGGIIED